MPEDKNVLHLDLDFEQEERVKLLIREYMGDILSKRGEMSLETQIQQNKDNYDGIPEDNDGPWEGATNYFVNMTATTIDVATIKSKRQTMNAKPIIMLEPENDMEDSTEELMNRAEWLDYELRKKINIEDVIDKVYQEACIQGTSILKVPHENEVENVSYVEKYNPTEEDYERYKWDTRDKAGQDKRENNLNKLGSYDDETGEFMPGEAVTIRKDEQRTVYFGPKPYRVPLKDFYVNPDIKDLRRQKLIAEKICMNWSDIQYRSDTEYFKESAVDELRNNEDYYKRDYNIYECVLYCDIEEKGKFKRYVITYEDRTDVILRAIQYPYEHGKIYYIPYYIKPKDDNFYGYGYAERLYNSQKLLNNTFNNIMHEASLRTNPPMAISDFTDRIVNTEWGPGAKYPENKPNSVRPLELKFGGNMQIELVKILQTFIEAESGISRGMSGQANPLDPNAPAAKTAMLLRESNIRIEDIIIELQKSNAELAFQVEHLINQYSPEEIEGRDFDFNTKVRYVPHGTAISINKGVEEQKIMNFLGLVGNAFPELLNDPKRKYRLLRLIASMTGGAIEQNKDDLIPTEEEAEEMQQAKIKQQQAQKIAQMLEGEDTEVLEQVEQNIQQAGGVQPGGMQ